MNGLQLQYNEDIIQCDFDERVDCGTRPVCDINDENCVPDNNIPDEFICPEPNGFFPNPDNCIKFYDCEDDVATPFACQVRKLNIVLLKKNLVQGVK